jgi:hypothetical protein
MDGRRARLRAGRGTQPHQCRGSLGNAALAPPTFPSRVPLYASHVTVRGNARHRRGIRVHRSRTLRPGHVTRRDGIPVTTPSRTLADLRRTLPRRQFAAALREAEFLGLPIDPQLGPDGTRSEMEAEFLGLCRRRRLPSRL